MPNKDEGYWFTTDKGVHVHVEPGETKEQALEKKFGSKKKNSNRKYEPAGGFEAEREHTTFYGLKENNKKDQSPTADYKTTRREVKYNGEWGEYGEMISKYGSTKQELKKAGISISTSENDRGIDNAVNRNYSKERRQYEGFGLQIPGLSSNKSTPKYTQTFYNEKGQVLSSWNTKEGNGLSNTYRTIITPTKKTNNTKKKK